MTTQEFIEKNYPNYDGCSLILYSDILIRLKCGEEVDESDKEYVMTNKPDNIPEKAWVELELHDTMKEIIEKAIENAE